MTSPFIYKNDRLGAARTDVISIDDVQEFSAGAGIRIRNMIGLGAAPSAGGGVIQINDPTNPISLDLNTTATGPGLLRFYDTGGVNSFQLQAADTMLTTVVMKWPTGAPTIGDSLVVTGANQFGFQTIVGGTADDSAKRTVIQAAHGFTLTNGIPIPVYWDTLGGVWVAATTLGAPPRNKQAFITEVTDANTFEIQMHGFHALTPGHGLTDGEYYWSTSVAPYYTLTKPTSGTAHVLWAVEGDFLHLQNESPFDLGVGVTTITGPSLYGQRTQTAHGFTLTNDIPIPVTWNAGTSLWEQAVGNSALTARQGFVTSVLDANTIVVSTEGQHALAVGHGLTNGEYYYLHTVAPYYTPTRPVTGIEQVLWWVEDDTLHLLDESPVAVTAAAVVTPGSDTLDITTAAAVAIGDVVEITGAGLAQPADADAASQPVGGVQSVLGISTTATAPGGTATVQHSGVVTGLAGLTPGAQYYLGAAGALTAAPVIATGNYVLFMGIAISATELLLRIGINGSKL